MDELKNAEGFEWDKGNKDKSKDRHGVGRNECEEVFFNDPLFIMDDPRHSAREKRFFALGRTFDGRRLTIVFTMRNNQIRVISARDMSRKERNEYEKAEKNSGL